MLVQVGLLHVCLALDLSGLVQLYLDVQELVKFGDFGPRFVLFFATVDSVIKFGTGWLSRCWGVCLFLGVNARWSRVLSCCKAGQLLEILLLFVLGERA